MHGRPGLDVLKGNHRIVAIDNIGLDLAIDNATEEAIAHRYLQINFSTN
jgi:hypothetical protein